MTVGSSRFEHLRIVEARPYVQFADDGTTLLVPLKLNRRVTEREVDLFASRDLVADSWLVSMPAASVEEIADRAIAMKALVREVSEQSMRAEEIVAREQLERADILARANVVVSRLTTFE